MAFYVLDNFVDTTIVDQSIAIPREAVLPKKLTILQPIFSSKGKANKILRFQSSGLVLDTYGQDMVDLKKYGQGGMNLIHTMSGGAVADVCRLLPENAETASAIVKLHLTHDDAIQVWERDVNGDFKVDSSGNKVPLMNGGVPVTLPGLRCKVTVTAGHLADDTDGNPTVNTAGESVIPLYKLKYYSAGKCGSDIGHRIGNDFARDDQTDDGRRYQMNFYIRDSLGNVTPYGQTYYFSTNPDSRIVKGSSTSEALSVAFPEFTENGAEREVTCKDFISDNYATLSNILSPYLRPDDGVVIDIDPIFCKDQDGKPYDQFQLDESAPDAVNFVDSIKFLIGGTDGSLQVGNTVKDINNHDVIVTPQMVEDTKKSLLSEFFKCHIDPKLFDERLIDADILLDANYDWDIKQVMLGKFRVLRPDIMVIADIGFAPNCQMAIPLVKSLYESVDGKFGWSAAVIVHSGTTTDRGIPVRVTGTYDWGRGLAMAFGRAGTFSIFAGYEMGKVETMRFDWYPFKDEFDTMIGPLTKLGCIFAIEMERDSVYAYMQEKNMYNERFSVLKSLRNGMVIGDAVRLGKKVLYKYVFDREGAEGAMRKASEELIASLSGRYPSGINVTPRLYRTTRDIALGASSCDMIYEFPGQTESWSLNIYARRSAADTAALEAAGMM